MIDYFCLSTGDIYLLWLWEMGPEEKGRIYIWVQVPWRPGPPVTDGQLERRTTVDIPDWINTHVHSLSFIREETQMHVQDCFMSRWCIMHLEPLPLPAHQPLPLRLRPLIQSILTPVNHSFLRTLWGIFAPKKEVACDQIKHSPCQQDYIYKSVLMNYLTYSSAIILVT